MRRLTLLVCFMFASISLDAVWNQCGAATYNGTGTWSYSFTNIRLSGNTNCTWSRNTTSGTAVVTQTGNSVKVVDNYNGATSRGTVSGTRVSISGSYPYNGGTMAVTINFTLTSNTSGSGTMTSRWTLGSNYCDTRADISLTKTSGTPTAPALLVDSAIQNTGGKISDVRLIGNNWSP